MEEGKKIKVMKDGPYKVTGCVPFNKLCIICDKDNNAVTYEEIERYPPKEIQYLCRCGKSYIKPFCDGSHLQDFDGTETGSREPYEKLARKIKGQYIDLMDAPSLCAVARFCDTYGTTWRLVRHSKSGNTNTLVIEQCNNCPAGRLTAVDKDGTVFEPELPQEISLLDDHAEEALGPLWIKGGISIESADGFTYPVRNRVTLCQCGRSQNKPFCDARHLDVPDEDHLTAT